MLRPARGGARIIRALALTAVVLGLAAAAHWAGGGAAPSAPALGWLALATLPFALIGTAVRLRAVPTAAALVVGQGAGHLVLMTAQSSPGACGTAAGHTHQAASLSGHLGHGGPAGEALQQCLGMAHTGGVDSMVPSPVMLVAHLLAAVLSGLLISRGEDVLWRVLGWLVRPLGRVVVPVSQVPRRFTVVAAPVSAAQVRVTRGRAPPSLLR